MGFAHAQSVDGHQREARVVCLAGLTLTAPVLPVSAQVSPAPLPSRQYTPAFLLEQLLKLLVS